QEPTTLRRPLLLMTTRKSPQQMRAEPPEFLRLTTENEELLAPLIGKADNPPEATEGDRPDEP
ncbi:hypothetical protein AMQ83_14475, partial [Paenibacillus riograndensis]